MIRLYKRCAVAFGCALLIFLHFYRLGQIPGLHYDEAWAMNYAWRIAQEPRFWPLKAMSPYTAPWAHYWAALWMKLLGPRVLVFRGSQVTLALLGITNLMFALPKQVRTAFPWAVLLLPGLLFNERFTIELTGFHVLCFGTMLLALRKQRYGIACLGALLGTTAHILFYAVPLALAALTMLEGRPLPKRARIAAICYFALMTLFFARVLVEIPEKGKAAALLASCLALLGLFAAHAEGWSLWQKPMWSYALGLSSLIYGFNCLFFAQGFWGASITTGQPPIIPFWIGATALLIVLARSWHAAPRWVTRAFLLLTVGCGVLMLKPAPRYFELPILMLAIVLSFDLGTWIFATKWLLNRRLLALSALMGLLALNLGLSLSQYARTPPVDSPLHFLFFKDSSRDFLDKQGLVRFLGGSGCAPDDIHTSDPRLKEELEALALGDWPVNRSNSCRWNFVARRSDENAVGEPWQEFVLRRKN